MNLRNRPYILFAILTLGVFIVSHIGFRILAHAWIGRSSVGEAVREALDSSITQPVATLFLVAPFVLLGWMAASLARERTLKRGLTLFTFGAMVLGLLYFSGHIGAEKAMRQQQWTAAALSVGLLPFQSIPIVILLFGVRILMSSKRSDRHL